jgi:hypothetical protein
MTHTHAFIFLAPSQSEQDDQQDDEQNESKGADSDVHAEPPEIDLTSV